MITKSRITKVACAICLLGMTVTGVYAAASQERGVVKSVNTSTHTLTLTGAAGKSDQTFTWSDTTKFTENGKSVSAAMVKPGAHVRIAFVPGGTSPRLESVTVGNAEHAQRTVGESKSKTK